MEKAKKRKNSVRTGVILTLAWLLVASLVMSVTAATGASGSTDGNKFLWSWQTDNTATNAAGTFGATLSESTLSLTISATSSTYVAEKKDGCGNVTQKEELSTGTINTATITNNTGSTISIVSVTATTATCSLAEKSQLANGATFTISITSNSQGTKDTTARTTNGSVVITYTVIENVNVVFYGADGASYTYNGVALSKSSDSKSEKVPVGNSITLPEAPSVSSGTFAGWRMSHDESLRSAGETVTINSDTSIYPIITMGGGVKPFTVGGTPYQFWTDAAKAAGNSGTIILNQNYTLPTTMAENGVGPAGSSYVTGTDGNVNFIIPVGVTLLIPYSDTATSNSNPLTEPERIAEKNTYVNPTAVRTLTVPANATINCAGNIRVDGRQYSASTQNTGHVYGGYGKIDLKGTINLTGTATLRAYGYITGSGTVNAASGTFLHELFQMTDWRGGNNTSGLYNGMKGDSFLISCFYIQNIESNLVMNSGATLVAHVTIAAGLIGDKTPYNSTAKLIASDGLFQLASGSKLTRSYSGGRMTYKVEGDATMGSISLNLSTGIGSFNMNSNEYILNLPSNVTLQFASGTSSMPVKAKLLPGTVIQVDSGATLKMTGTSELVIYDRDDWTSGTYTYTGNFNAVKYAVGSRMTSLPNVPGQLIVNGTLEVNDKAAVYSTNKVNPGNGNAGLSGTGKIVINGTPDTARTTVKEVTGSNQTTTTIAVVPLLAKVSGVSNTPTTSLSVGKTYYGVGDNYWCAHDDMDENGLCNACDSRFFALVDGEVFCNSIDEVEAIPEKSTIHFYRYTITDTFDLQGCAVTGNVSIGNGGKIIDSDSNGYGSTTGYIKVADASTLPAVTTYAPDGVTPKHYVKVDNGDGTVSFHRVAVSLTGIQFVMTPGGAAYLSFEGTFRGNATAAGTLEQMGFELNGVESFFKDVAISNDLHAVYFTKKLDTAADVTTAQALLKIENADTPLESQSRDISAVLKTLYKADMSALGLDETQQTAIRNFLSQLN